MPTIRRAVSRRRLTIRATTGAGADRAWSLPAAAALPPPLLGRGGKSDLLRRRARRRPGAGAPDDAVNRHHDHHQDEEAAERGVDIVVEHDLMHLVERLGRREGLT